MQKQVGVQEYLVKLDLAIRGYENALDMYGKSKSIQFSIDQLKRKKQSAIESGCETVPKEFFDKVPNTSELFF